MSEQHCTDQCSEIAQTSEEILALEQFLIRLFIYEFGDNYLHQPKFANGQ